MKPLHEQLKEAIDWEIDYDINFYGEVSIVNSDKVATSCSEIVKEYAKGFAEWIEEEAYFTDIGEDEEHPIWVWLLYKEINISINRPTYTIDELFALFLKETESNQQEVNNG